MLAIIDCPDSGPLDSLAYMLREAGYECAIPNREMCDLFRSIGCDTVSLHSDLVNGGSYERNSFSLPAVGPDALFGCDLYFNMKAHRNSAKIWPHFPRLKGKTVWYRINGGLPEVSERGGDEVNLPCQIITPNLWYEGPLAYAFWPAFVRMDDYTSHWRLRNDTSDPRAYASAACLIHNVKSWGYGALVDDVRALGVKMYGDSSPDGQIPHTKVPEVLAASLAMVHLKSNDCPGYAMYEAIAAGCPLVVPRRLIRRMKMQALLVPEESCLCWDTFGDDDYGRGLVDIPACVKEIGECLDRLLDTDLNRSIALNARNRLTSLMWNPARDLPSLKDWLARNFK